MYPTVEVVSPLNQWIGCTAASALPLGGVMAIPQGGSAAVRILVVDDDPLVGPAIKAVLENNGHEVIGPCRDAAKAFRRLTRERPDLAIVDFNLAGGENGLSLARKLKDLHAVPSLVVSGYSHRAAEAREVAVGFLHKPFTPRALLAATSCVEAVIGGSPSPAVLRAA